VERDPPILLNKHGKVGDIQLEICECDLGPRLPSTNLDTAVNAINGKKNVFADH
jgi:hypothetical protein